MGKTLDEGEGAHKCCPPADWRKDRNAPAIPIQLVWNSSPPLHRRARGSSPPRPPPSLGHGPSSSPPLAASAALAPPVAPLAPARRHHILSPMRADCVSSAPPPAAQHHWRYNNTGGGANVHRRTFGYLRRIVRHDTAAGTVHPAPADDEATLVPPPSRPPRPCSSSRFRHIMCERLWPERHSTPQRVVQSTASRTNFLACDGAS
ncbi:hypothetical protein PVAP13_8NG146902 [Panicum virgatum]|uniref:Uncharacterized protein n=1 Tax=Panicum virgatum TaxID=38727 RepID=A0A8T0PFB8_PANVG|nr:hypothetical protein PVAP13_8NG146902 [Panicum virgatum]